MRYPTAVDALVRWLVLAMAGLGLLLVLPHDLFGPDPVLHVAGLPATAANLVGLSLMFVAWLSFLVRLYTLRGRCRSDRRCRAFFGLFVVAALGSWACAVAGPVEVLVGLGLVAVVAQGFLAFRADHVSDRRPVRGGLAASRS